METVEKLLKKGFFVSCDNVRILVVNLIRDVTVDEIVEVVGEEDFLVESVLVTALHRYGVRVTRL